MRAAAIGAAVGLTLAACHAPTAGDHSVPSWEHIPNRYAKHFEVLRNGSERMLLVFSDTARADTLGAYRFSAAKDRPVGVLPAVLHRLVLGSTTHVPFVSALNGLDAVAGCTHLADVRDTLVRQRLIAAGAQEVIGGDGIDRERIVAMHPEAVSGYPFGRQEGDRLAQLGVPVIEVAEYLEEHPLGKAEWLRFFGVLLGQEQRADSSFSAIAARYETVRDASTPSGERPLVFFGSTWEKQWFVPPGNSYMAQLITDAGGAYMFRDRDANGNITLDAERTIGMGGAARWWGTLLASTAPVTGADIAGGDTRVEQLPAFREHRVFYGNSAESDLFGDAALHPDVLLADLRAIFHGDSTVTNTYFRIPAQNRMPSRR